MGFSSDLRIMDSRKIQSTALDAALEEVKVACMVQWMPSCVNIPNFVLREHTCQHFFYEIIRFPL